MPLRLGLMKPAVCKKSAFVLLAENIGVDAHLAAKRRRSSVTCLTRFFEDEPPGRRIIILTASRAAGDAGEHLQIGETRLQGLAHHLLMERQQAFVSLAVLTYHVRFDVARQGYGCPGEK
jgi:hypothetical protein